LGGKKKNIKHNPKADNRHDKNCGWPDPKRKKTEKVDRNQQSQRAKGANQLYFWFSSKDGKLATKQKGPGCCQAVTERGKEASSIVHKDHKRGGHEVWLGTADIKGGKEKEKYD